MESEVSQLQPEYAPFYIWGDWAMAFTQPNPMATDVMGPTKKVYLGSTFSILIDYEGQLWSWGFHNQGCLGLNDMTVAKQPVQIQGLEGVQFTDVAIGENHVLALSNGTIYAWGSNEFGQLGVSRQTVEQSSTPLKIQITDQVEKIYCSANSSYAVTQQMTGYSWGQNDKGQLGIKSTLDSDYPQSFTQYFNVPIKDLIINKKQVIAIPFIQEYMSQSSFQEQYDDESEVSEEEKDDVMELASRQNTGASRKNSRSERSQSNRSINMSRQMHRRRGFESELAETLKDSVEVMIKIYTQLKLIDDILIDSVVPSDQLDTRVDLKELTKKIHRVKEACNKEISKFEGLLPGEKQWITYKNFLISIMLDSINLRSITLTQLKMMQYERKLHHRNLIQLDQHSYKQVKAKVRSQELYYASLYCSKKVMNKIKQLETHFRTLSHGCNLLVGECLRWSPSCVNTMAILVAGINKAFKDSNKEQEHLEEKENKRQVADAIMAAYRKMQSSSIYKIMGSYPFDPQLGLGVEEYVQKVIKISDRRVNKYIAAINDIKLKQQQFFSSGIKNLYKLMIENGELRKLINALQRKILSIEVTQ